MNNILRFPSIDEVVSNNLLTEEELTSSIEGQIAILLKHYQGVTTDLTKFNLIENIDEAVNFCKFVHNLYSRFLFKVPLRSDFIYAFTLLKVYGLTEARRKLKNHVLEQNECKYLKQCLQKFLEWTPIPLEKQSDVKVIKIRYYGPIGTTGYATICRNIVHSMYHANQYFDIQFIPLSVQNFNPNDDNEGNRLLRSLCCCQSLEGFYRPLAQTDSVDVVILHSVCDLWIPIVRREKSINANVLTIGITVWETDAIPPQWIPHVRWVDRLTVPNKWNRDVFQRDVPEIDVTYLPHPVFLQRTTTIDNPPSLDIPFSKHTYMFYTINEWNGRKGLELLIQAFVNEFSASDDVILFIKTHGKVSQDLGSQYIKLISQSRTDPPKIILDSSHWTDAGIQSLHAKGHCYISLTRSEGHGLGACYAALSQKYVIMSNYGGQKDYLTAISWVPCSESPAFLCTPFDARHQSCGDLPCCRDFSYFIAAQQKWGLPDTSAARKQMRNAYQNHLSGDRKTVDYLANFNADAVGKGFVDFIMSSVYLKEGSRVSIPRVGLKNTYDVSAELLKPLNALGIDSSTVLVSTRPKLVIIGAGLYGNFGDDSYINMHTRLLSEKYELYFCNTTTFLDKSANLRYMSDYSEEILLPFDYLVIGGGGLMNDGENSSSIFQIYFPYCQKYNIPVSVISVGFGYKFVENECDRTIDSLTYSNWSTLLEYAESISVRSHSDKERVLSMISKKRHHRVGVFADACYGLEVSTTTKKDLIVFIPTNFFSLVHPDILLFLQNQRIKFPHSKIVMIEMGGTGTEIYPNAFITEETKRLKSFFPDAVVFSGRQFWGSMRKLFELNHKCTEADDQTPEKVISLLQRANVIATGRYHGLVLARLLNIPFYIGSSSLHKVVQELRDNLDPTTWKGHYKLLKTAIDSHQRFGKLPDPYSWDENLRNTCITDIVTNSTMSVPFVQNYTNEQLWEKRQEIFLSLEI